MLNDKFLLTRNGTRTLIIARIHSHHIDFIFLPECGGSDTEAAFGRNMDLFIPDSYISENKLNQVEIIKDQLDSIKEDNDYGTIKWDGCSDWDFGGSSTRTHLCSTDDMDELTLLVKECYKYAADNLETWFGD